MKYFGCILLLWICIFGNLHGTTADTTKILLLNSYHQGYEWTDMITQSIQSEFDAKDYIVELMIEYMDTKRYNSTQYFELLMQMYRHKYAKIHIDLIIISDNYALEFLKLYRHELFPELPVVFCGVDNVDSVIPDSFSNITGVDEDYHLDHIIETALRLHPETESIAVVSDRSEEGKKHIQLFRNSIAQFKKTYQIIEIVDWTVDELKVQLQALTKRTIVFRFNFRHPRDSTYLNEEEGAKLWLTYCNIPTYTSLGHKVRDGVIGGTLNTANIQALTVVKLAERILTGESANDIPIVGDSVEQQIFDYVQMRRFHLDEKDLPENSIIINRPFSFYREYKYLVWTVFVIFSALALLIIFLLINIVSRRVVQKALKESERKYRILVETVPNGIIEIDLTGNIIFTNTAFQNMVSYSENELKLKLISDLEDNGQSIEEQDFIIRLLEATTDVKQKISKYRAKNGKFVDVQLDWRLKQDEYGNAVGIISIVSDISQRLKAERDAKIRQQQLIQADKMAALGTLVSGVAHEINNPNNFIMLNIPTLQRTWKSILPILEEHYKYFGDFKISGIEFTIMRSEFFEICANILEGSSRISSIVKDLKEYSRKEETEVLVPVNINDMIKSCVNLLGNNIKKYTDYFSIELAEPLPNVNGNFQHFEQVVINLIQNSCQALGDKTKKIKVQTLRSKNGQRIEIRILDEGIGISKEILSRICDPFFTTKRNSGGTGLGLSVSNSIIQKYKGNLRFISHPGEGTTAIISFPIA
ncbi:MAG: PAS domain S-box protein [Deferribacteres bacterium]|nr:PAS domain S-box protein [candidate division KSB1 bacterium]MCB9502218.1 PAS domain S-box protein [Deferribacteres bacterium]